jgi:hypothetical protein
MHQNASSVRKQSSHSLGKTPLRKQGSNAPDRDKETQSGWNSRLSSHGPMGKFSEVSPYQKYVKRRAEVRIHQRTRTKGLVATQDNPEPDWSVVGCTTIPYSRFQAMGSRYLQQWGYFKPYFAGSKSVTIGNNKTSKMDLERFARTRPQAGCIRTSEWTPRDVLCWTAMCLLFKVSYAGKHNYSWGQFRVPSSDYTAARLVQELVEDQSFLVDTKKYAFRFGKYINQVRSHKPVKRVRHKPKRFDVELNHQRHGSSAREVRKTWVGQHCSYKTHKESLPLVSVTRINGRNYHFPPIVQKAIRRILTYVVLIPKPKKVLQKHAMPLLDASTYVSLPEPAPEMKPPTCDLSNYRAGLVLTDRYYSTSSGFRNVLRARFPNEYLRLVSSNQ